MRDETYKTHVNLEALKTKLLVFLTIVFALNAYAGSAIWNLNPISNDWWISSNWTPATVPNGSSDIATFDVSNVTDLVIKSSATTEVNSIVFDAGASDFAFTIGDTTRLSSLFLVVSGTGIVNNSGLLQTFFVLGSPAENIVPNGIIFRNNATAGDLTQFTNSGGTRDGDIGGEVFFQDTSTAGSGVFLNLPGSPDGCAGSTEFFDSSSAGKASVENFGANPGTCAGYTIFEDSSIAGNATIINHAASQPGLFPGNTNFRGSSSADNGVIQTDGSDDGGTNGGVCNFWDFASAGNAVLIANGGSNGGNAGSFGFINTTTGGTARVQLLGAFSGGAKGTLSIAGHNSPGLTIGSLEGNGSVFLGENQLTIGSNNLSTSFAGVIQDSGSIAKIGTGKLTLTGANSYTGNTVVETGTLLLNNQSGSVRAAATCRLTAPRRRWNHRRLGNYRRQSG